MLIVGGVDVSRVSLVDVQGQHIYINICLYMQFRHLMNTETFILCAFSQPDIVLSLCAHDHNFVRRCWLGGA